MKEHTNSTLSRPPGRRLSIEAQKVSTHQSLYLWTSRMSRTFDKKVKRRSFKVGDLVLAVRRPMKLTRRTKGKFEPKWEGPFIVSQVFSNSAYQLTTEDGSRTMPPVNGRLLKKYETKV